MALKYGVQVRDPRLNQIETTIGTSPIMRILTGSPPANCATATSGTLLAELTLPSDWMSGASSGSKAKLGTWTDASANATGTAGYFRIFESTGTTCHIQGTITASGGGGDMIVDSTSLTAGQTFTVLTFTLTEGNA
jgi:hypothetical protein